MIASLLLSLALGAPSVDSGGGSARTLAQADGKLALGVFRPWTFRVSERTDLTTTGLLGSLLSPRVDLKHRFLDQGDAPVSMAVVGGVNSPTPALLLAKGWLYTDSAQIPFALQAKAGVLVSRQMQRLRLTAGAELRGGFAAGSDHDLTPRDLFFYDWAMAPIAEGPVVTRLSLQADLLALDNLLFTGALYLQAGPQGTDLASRWFALWGVSDRVALGLGWFTQLDQRPDGARHYMVPGGDLQLRF